MPYLRMPRTSPKACLNAVPKAIALSCIDKPSQHVLLGLRGGNTYLWCGDRLSRGRPYTSWSGTCLSASREHGTSARRVTSELLHANRTRGQEGTYMV